MHIERAGTVAVPVFSYVAGSGKRQYGNPQIWIAVVQRVAAGQHGGSSGDYVVDK